MSGGRKNLAEDVFASFKVWLKVLWGQQGFTYSGEPGGTYPALKTKQIKNKKQSDHKWLQTDLKISVQLSEKLKWVNK